MDKIEIATRQLGSTFSEKWKELHSGKNGTGFMFWDDCDHSIYADFFGDYESDRKVTIVSTLIITNDELGLPYSLRIGFHETENVARKTMMELFNAEEPESHENNQSGG